MERTKLIEVQIVHAFVDNNAGGNPAGIVLEADTLTKEQQLKIAAAIGLSETAFVSKSDIADFKLHFFTPTRQIAHCGHATIATFSLLSQLNQIEKLHTSKETIDGRREILIQGELAFMEQKAPIYRPVAAHLKAILASLSLDETDILENAVPELVNTGNSFVLIPVANKAVLKKIRPHFDLIAQISEDLDLIGFYVFSTETDDSERDANARMFAPRYGIEEEAGTGMAAGPLACYLYDRLSIKKPKFLIQQGWFMAEPSPSLIIVDLEVLDGQIVRLFAGGKGKISSKMIVEV